MKTKSFFNIAYFLLLIGFTTLLQVDTTQAQVGAKEYSFGTLANNSNRIPSDSVTIDLFKVKKELGITQIDSISITMMASGEIDIDTVDVYFGSTWKSEAGKNFVTWDATVVTFICTINLADGVTGREELLVSNAVITKAHLKNVDAIKILTRGATAGNDATDTGQNATVKLLFYGS